MTALGGGLPVDFIETVTGDIFAQFLEFSALAVLAPGVNAVAAPVEEECGQAVPFSGQVGIYPDLAGDLPDTPEGPETQERLRFEITPVDTELTAPQGGAGPQDTHVFSSFGKNGKKVFLRARDFARKGKPQAERSLPACPNGSG